MYEDMLKDLNGLIENAKVYGIHRIGYNISAFLSKWGNAFDNYLVTIKHPSAYQPGTTEYRIRKFIEERLGR